MPPTINPDTGARGMGVQGDQGRGFSVPLVSRSGCSEASSFEFHTPPAFAYVLLRAWTTRSAVSQRNGIGMPFMSQASIGPTILVACIFTPRGDRRSEPVIDQDRREIGALTMRFVLLPAPLTRRVAVTIMEGNKSARNPHRPRRNRRGKWKNQIPT